MRIRSILPLLLALLTITVVLLPSLEAQSNPPHVVIMEPGSYYDPGACASVQVFGGYYFCSAPPTPVPATDTPTSVPATNTPTDTPTSVPTATATSTATSTPIPPTSTATATATATIIPPTATVIVVTSTPTPGTAGALAVNGVPLCGVPQANGQVFGPQHDPTKWHPLVERNAAGAVLCTYGHEHGMDPHSVDSLFGPLPLASEISYPWATVSATGVLENDSVQHPNKHRVYKWITAPSLTCSLNSSPDGSSKMVTAFREEFHADGSLGAAVRFHSYFGQYQLTDCAHPTDIGYMQIGGHMDYGQLKGYNAQQIPLPGVDPVNCLLNGDGRQEGELGKPAQSASVWYGSNSRATSPTGATPKCDDDQGVGPHVGVQANITTSNIGPVDRNNPSSVLLYAPNLGLHNGTGISTDALTVGLSGFKTDSTGHINFTGHVDRHGRVVPEVAGQAPGMDYIPLIIKNGLSRGYGANGAAPCVGNLQHCPVTIKDDVPGPQGQAGWYVLPPS